MKRKKMQPRAGILIAIIVVVALGGLIALTSRDIPAPEGMVEKPLEASRFLNPQASTQP